MLALIQKASQKDQVAALEKAADKIRPSLRRSFLEALEQVKDEATLKRITERLEAEDADGAANLLVAALGGILAGSGVRPESTVFIDQWRKAHDAGAAAGISSLPDAKAKAATFDPFNSRTANTVREYTGDLIREVSESTRAGIITALQETDALGYGPTKQARFIRDMLGLTEQQMKAVVNFRDQLEQQRNAPLNELGKPRGMTKAANRRLSATERAIVRRHIREGHLSQQKIDEMVDRYYRSLLNRRAQNIARTESLTAATMGQNEAWTQAQEQGVLDSDVKRKWLPTRDARTRDAHSSVPGMNPDGVPINGTFSTPLGRMRFPRDPRGTAANRIQCRCAVVLVNP